MPSVKTCLCLLRCVAVVICFSLLTPAIGGKSLPVSTVSGDSGASAAFVVAAERNAKLKFDLNWAFGAKQQRGWHLYTSLIQRTIGVSAAPESSAFAQALAAWQRSEALAPTGVLDKETWIKMVAV